MSDLAKQLARLSPEQRAELLRRLQQQKPQAPPPPAAATASPIAPPPADRPPGAIPPRPAARKHEVPLSFAQQRLWLLYELDPHSAAYNLASTVHLRGRLDPLALERSLAVVAARHETLRTTFHRGPLGPVQRIADTGAIPWTSIDLSTPARSAQARETQLQARIQQLAATPFDLTTGPLLRATLFTLATDEHVLLVCMHHIIGDGWSFRVLIRDLLATYRAIVAHQIPHLPPLGIQYPDFALWQTEHLHHAALLPHLAYWREQLAAASGAIELPVDRPYLPGHTDRGAQASIPLSPTTSDALKTLTASEGASPFMGLLASFAAVLFRYSGQRDLCIGIPTAGRKHIALEALVGFFVNSLVIRVQLAPEQTFRQLLGHARATVMDAFSHDQVPLETLIAELKPPRLQERNPLVQVMFSYQRMDLEPLRSETLDLSFANHFSGSAPFELSLFVTEQHGRLSARCEYRCDLFDATTIDRLLMHWQRLLAAAVAAPDQPLAALPWLDDAERQPLAAWGRGATTPAPDIHCIHALFAAQAARTPDAIAVLCEEQSLTYAALDARANQLARHLQSLGVGPETRVGLCVPRSPELIIGLLGILKAGGAYVALDPNHPPARLAYTLRDAAAQVLITQAALGDTLAEHRGARVLLDADAPTIARHAPSAPDCHSQPDNLAYLIYTSGSTGQPKGVAVPHRGVPNLVHALARALDLQATSRVLQFASFAFDASVWEITSALLTGATLCIVPQSALSTDHLPDRVRQLGITHALLPPSLLAVLPVIEDALPGLATGGQACPREVAARWAPGRRLINAYGPTEATVCSTFATCRAGDPQAPPIGLPLDHTEAHVLDDTLAPVPIGVAGELYVGGIGLARGYLHRPGLTAERFVPHPFADAPGARLYRTGDRVRRRPDGQLEFLGRRDNQIKLRGFRIELGEIEAALQAHPALAQAVVVLRHDLPNDPMLVAWLVAHKGEAAPADTELRGFLRTRLPEYMVPAAFVPLAALPLLPSGKIDREAVLGLSVSTAATSKATAAPRTPLETQLARLMAEVLHRDQVGIHDSFFDLGGHSLLATQLVSRIRSTLGHELPLRVLFDASTVAALAARLEPELPRPALSRPAPPAPGIPRLRGDQAAAPPLSFAQQRLWFLDQLAPASPFYNLPAAMRLHGTLDRAALQRSLDRLVHRHHALRTTFGLDHNRQPIQRIAPAAPVPLPCIDLSDLAPAARQPQARTHLHDQATQPFDLGRGPLLRASLLRLAPDEHILLLTMHHIIIDGWSINLLIRELATTYAALAAGQTTFDLGELPLQYADYAAWQRDWLQGEILATQLAYWQTQLGGPLPILDLPLSAGRIRPPRQTHHGALYSMVLPAHLTAALHAFSQRHGTTLFMTLLAAFYTLLHRYTGQTDLIVGSPIADRTRVETEALIGFFINTLALRCDLSGDPSFTALLGQVRETTLGAYAHQDLPFEKLVETLRVDRDLSRTPIFQVLFALQNLPSTTVALPGLTLETLEIAPDIAKFDLSLYVSEMPEGQGLRCAFEYNTDLFDAQHIARMAAHYHTLLGAILAQPDIPLSQLPLLPPAEQTQLLCEWNAAADRLGPSDACLHTLVFAQAARTPEHTAVIDGDRQLDYATLARHAQALARVLRQHGVRAETPVGLYVQRGWEMIVGLLGILAAGGTYVPLDPGYPPERIAFILADAKVPLVLTHPAHSERLPAQAARILPIDPERQDWQPLAAGADDDLLSWPTAAPEQLAYLIYTSGSTGRPKGVAVEHRNAVSFLRWAQRVFSAEQLQGTLAATSIAFDISVFELFLPLTVGAAVIVAQNALALPDLPARDQVTLLNTVPAAVSQLLRDQQVPSSVRTINLGGEAVPAALADAAYQQAHVERVYDLYGPSETTVYSTHALRQPGQPATIGRPIDGTRVYVLDVRLNPVPIGISGELYIGGLGVTRGYLGRPGLTAERFVPDPFVTSSPGGARLYRTGDRARWNPDGTLEFQGRLDFQVKLRGFRIELGEIEATLMQHPAVRDAAALLREDRPGDPRLVAYLIARDPAQPPVTQALRAFLQDKLPEAMIPSVFALVPAFPRSPNGKLDRRGFPRPEHSQLDSGRTFAPPTTALEQAIARIWQDTLALSRVSLDDPFFEVGGNSMLALQVHQRLTSELELAIPLTDLFQYPTIRMLIAHTTAPSRDPGAAQAGRTRAETRRARSLSWSGPRPARAPDEPGSDEPHEP